MQAEQEPASKTDPKRSEFSKDTKPLHIGTGTNTNVHPSRLKRLEQPSPSSA